MRKEVLVNFESEGKEGIVAVGTYLMDAAKRLGVAVDDRCTRQGFEDHNCVMKVGSGAGMLSPPTQVESELLSAAARNAGERLACQTRIEKPGEISIMAVKKEEEKAKEKESKQESTDQFKKEFEKLPLEKKIASLVELEAIALGETFSYVLNSPYSVAEKVLDVMAEFGLDLERKDKEAKTPKEHKKEAPSEAENGGEQKKPSTEKKKAKRRAPRKTKSKKKDE